MGIKETHDCVVKKCKHGKIFTHTSHLNSKKLCYKNFKLFFNLLVIRLYFNETRPFEVHPSASECYSTNEGNLFVRPFEASFV